MTSYTAVYRRTITDIRIGYANGRFDIGSVYNNNIILYCLIHCTFTIIVRRLSKSPQNVRNVRRKTF